MASENGLLRRIAWVYFAGFAFVVIVTHVPAFNDAEGRSFGLFQIDPRDDFVHILSAIAGFAVALTGRWIRPYLWTVALLYGVDALVGMFTSQGLLDLSVFTHSWRPPDFSIKNFAINLPHFVITGVALAVLLGRSPAPHAHAAS
jgi:hypothetical protein